jgi:hypothetical protein
VFLLSHLFFLVLGYVAEDVLPVEDYAFDGFSLVFLLSAWL